MARTAVPPTTHARNVNLLQDAGVAIDAANGHVIAAPQVSGQAVLLDIDSTFAGAKSFTVKAGVQPGSTDQVISLNAQRGWILLGDRAYAQSDGTFLIDVQAGAAGTIRARYLPHH
jgi:hypothetical protein